MKITTKIANKIYTIAYHILEYLDGEKKRHLKVISYAQAERMKMTILTHVH